jgi:hypothetical protein
MALQRRSQIGVTPSKAQKLKYIADNLGLPGIADMQGSTVNIYDTVAISTGTGRQVLNFFANTSNKSRTFSNFQTGTLNAGEAMISEEIAFIALTASGPDLTSDSTAITVAGPVQAVSATGLPNKPSVTLGLMNFTIANRKVVKDLNTFEQDPAFNPRSTGVAVFDTATATIVRFGESKIYLEAPPVIPPNQKIQLTLEISPTGTIPANSFIMCVIGRFGSIFSSKSNL